MDISLSNLADNLTEGIHKIKYKERDCFLEYESVEGNSIKYICLSYDKIIQTKLMKNYYLKNKEFYSNLNM